MNCGQFCRWLLRSALSFGLLVSPVLALADSALQPPLLFQPLVGGTGLVNQPLTLNVSVAGGPVSHFQWYKNGLAIPGAIFPYLGFDSLQPSDAGTYSFTAGNLAGSITSNQVTITTTTDRSAATFGNSIFNVTLRNLNDAYVGDSSMMIVSSWNIAPSSTQWSRNGVPVAGQTSPTYSATDHFADTTPVTYSVDMTASGQKAHAEIKITPLAVAPVFGWPEIVPMNVDATKPFSVGQTVSLNELLLGPGPITYQWLKNGQLVYGDTYTQASGTLHAFGPLTLADSGAVITLVATNRYGTSSKSLTFRVQNSLPVFDQQPIVTPSVANGVPMTGFVSVSGNNPISLTWLVDGFASTLPSAHNQYFFPVDDHLKHTYQVVATNPIGSVQSAIVTIQTAPVITIQPLPQMVAVGQPINLTPTVTGTGVAYQWYKNGTALVGANQMVLTIPTAGASNTGNYKLVATAYGTSVTTNEVTVQVMNGTSLATDPPVITVSPVSQAVTIGSSASLLVAATGSPPLTYQWTLNGRAIACANATTFTAKIAGSYQVTVTGPGGTITSSPALVTVASNLPVIQSPVTGKLTIQNQSNSIAAPSSVALLSVVASGSAPLTYVWQKDGVVVPNATTASVLLPGPVAPAATATYTVTISNALGHVTSLPFLLSASYGLPTITSQPASKTVTAGSDFSLAVVAVGTGTLAYQWFKDGAAIPGATNYYYEVASASDASNGIYTVNVTGPAGSVTSDPAMITSGMTAPKILQQPSSVVAAMGASVTLRAVAFGSDDVYYQWFKGGDPVGSLTSTSRGVREYSSLAGSYTINQVNSGSTGSYSVKIWNGLGQVTSQPATVSLEVVPNGPGNAPAPIPEPNPVPASSTGLPALPTPGDILLDGGF